MPAPASPCIGLCRLDRHGICEGCGRSLDEISEWSGASPERQQAIVDAARARAPVGSAARIC